MNAEQLAVREQRGVAIASQYKISRKGGVWLVPSQSGKGRYTVCPDPKEPHCSCPDHELTGGKCKHIFAVETIVRQKENADGTMSQVATIRITEKISKPTSRQAWSPYNAAQTNEKDKFQSLLHDVCRGIQSPPYKKTGRPAIPLCDAVFAACFKVYSTVSGRRFMSDLREAAARGYLSQVPHYNSIFRCLENPALAATLKALVVETSLPLKTVEVDFACDSTGFAGTPFVKWFDYKHNKERKWHKWCKAHYMVGVKTNIITSAEVVNADGADSPYMPGHVRQTAKNFTIREVSADKGFSTVENHEVVAEAGGMPYIAFKSVATGFSGGLWQKCFHYFSFRRDDFLAHYHKRSNAETTASMIKAKFRDSLRSKSDAAMVNEVYCKIVCHNIVCLIHEMYELGIEPVFWAGEANEQAVLPMAQPI